MNTFSRLRLQSLLVSGCLLCWFLFFMGCPIENRVHSETQTTITITVVKNGVPQADVSVYSFRHGLGSPFFRPFSAEEEVITDSRGRAVFDVHYNYGIGEQQRTLHFGVFAGSHTDPLVLGHVGTTIRKGTNVSKTIDITR